jgi:hypothetical protein
MSQSQNSSIKKQVDKLNQEIAPKIAFKINGDSILVKILGKTKILYLSRSSKSLRTYNKKGIKRSEGPLGWNHLFNSMTSTSAHFWTDFKNRLRLTVSFAGTEMKLITGKKGLQGCVNSGPDFLPHDVGWSGNTSLTIGFDIEFDNERIAQLCVESVLINGQLKRLDNKRLPTSFKSTLQNKLKRTFQGLFDSEHLAKIYQK